MQITFCCFVSHCSVAQNENSNNSSRHWRSIAFDIFAPPAKGGGWSQQGKRGGRRGRIGGGDGQSSLGCRRCDGNSDGDGVVASANCWVCWVAFVVHPRRQQQLLLVAAATATAIATATAATAAAATPSPRPAADADANPRRGVYVVYVKYQLLMLRMFAALLRLPLFVAVAVAVFASVAAACCCRCRWRLLFWPRVAGNVLFMALAAIGQAVAAWISNLMLHVRYPLAACNVQRATGSVQLATRHNKVNYCKMPAFIPSMHRFAPHFGLLHSINPA